MYYATIEESITDILKTVKGSRVMLPEYGSELYKLVDRKIDDTYRADLTIFIANALESEPRIILKSVNILSNIDGKVTILITTDKVEAYYEF